ncbi:MAG: hypothetical protein ABSE79_04800 [Terriglobia bacterium]|jgi:hypothetical protein
MNWHSLLGAAMSYLPLINTIVTVLGVIFLGIYAFATRGIRIAAQDQTEGQHKPCLTLCARGRDYINAVIEPGHVVGAMVLADQNGSLSLQNLGNGLALNIQYEVIQLEPSNDRFDVTRGSYLQHLPSGESFPIPVVEPRLRGRRCEFNAKYQSLGGRRYVSRIRVDDAVITKIVFAEIKRPWYRW